MEFKNIPVPEVYKESQDFRFFLDWFEKSLTQLKFDTENAIDCYDPLRCKTDLLWLLGDTIGYKYDDRLCAAFNRLVILYFMSMIKLKGSKDGVTLAAEINLAQFRVNEDAKSNTSANLYERLEDTSIPVNSVYVTPYVDEGYIDIVYFSSSKPIDACLEYVRPLGMYCFQQAGVRADSRTKVSVDARLTNTNDLGTSIGPTHVGHYRREDYARMQKSAGQKLLEDDNLTGYRVKPKYEYEVMKDSDGNVIRDDEGNPKVTVTSVKYQVVSTKTDKDGKQVVLVDDMPSKSEAAARIPKFIYNDTEHRRHRVYNRNKVAEGELSNEINPGYRAMYSLQLANNEHIVKALVPEIFSIGFGPDTVDTRYADDYLKYNQQDKYSDGRTISSRPWNLRYDIKAETDLGKDVYTNDTLQDVNTVKPAVNPVMTKLGEAISMNPADPQNKMYTKRDDKNVIRIVDVKEDE